VAAAGEALKDVKFDAIYASDLERAHDTAKAVANVRKVNMGSVPHSQKYLIPVTR
jgi:broad specificity phosphatase PhoE